MTKILKGICERHIEEISLYKELLFISVFQPFEM